MNSHKVVSREAWTKARVEFLAQEKEFTRLRDKINADRRALPWVRVEKKYVFEGPQGKETLAQLFGGKEQLIVQHFMMGPDWEHGCKSCSFWADNYANIPVHLAHRDVTLLAVSRAPLAKIEAFKQRMGWGFKWVSSNGSDFNFDYGVSFTPEQYAAGKAQYNFAPFQSEMDEMPGISVFFKDADAAVYHTYSTYSRGLDMMNGAYHYLDLAPKGRDEANLPATMSWLRHHDRYES